MKITKQKWQEEEQSVVQKLSKYPISENSEDWIKTQCPNCKSQNWVIANRLPVESQKDGYVDGRVEACKCFKCKTIFWVSEKTYNDYKTELTLAKVYIYKSKSEEDVLDGKENPN